MGRSQSQQQRRLRLSSASVLLAPLLLLLVLVPTADAQDVPWLRTAGGSLVNFDCTPAYLNGFNTYGWVTRLMKEGEAAREEFRSLLDAAKAAGFTALRVHAFPDGPGAPSVSPTAGGYSDVLGAVDFMVDQARKRGMRVVLVATDSWHPNGRAAFVALSPSAKGNADAFWSDAGTKDAYKAHLTNLVGHANAASGGALYGSDPTVAAWDLVNEPSCTGCGGNAQCVALCKQAIQDWIEEMAAFLKRLAPLPLLTVGGEAISGSGASGVSGGGAGSSVDGQDFFANHESPMIDFAGVSAHLRALSEPNYDAVRAWALATMQDAFFRLRKPLLVEAVGKAIGSVEAPEESRDPYYTEAFNLMLQSVQQRGPLQGMFIQGMAGWQPPSGRDNNTVYAQDSTILDVVKPALLNINSYSHQLPLIEGCKPGQNRAFLEARAKFGATFAAFGPGVVSAQPGAPVALVNGDTNTTVEMAEDCANACELADGCKSFRFRAHRASEDAPESGPHPPNCFLGGAPAPGLSFDPKGWATYFAGEVPESAGKDGVMAPWTLPSNS